MKKFSIVFTIAFLVLSFAVGSIAEALQIDAGVTMNLVVTVVASCLAASWFVKQHDRRPSSQELTAFALQSTLGAWIASAILTVIVYTFLASSADVVAMLRSFSIGMLIVVLLASAIVISLLYYVVIRWSFSWFAKLQRTA